MTAEKMEPQERIEKYLLGQATPADVDVLNELLAKDEQLRKLYRFRVAMEGGYREAAIRGEVSEPPFDVASDKAELKQSSRKGFLSGFAVAAASLAVVALFAIMLSSRTDRDTQTARDAAISEHPVARLVASVDADWREIEPMSGTLLAAGSYRLDAGTVELEFNRGARVTLQGPSSFELKSTDLLHVSSGNLVARIPEEAIGFTITTNEAEVVDLGTEFGLRVGDGGQTEVHVIEGLVEVFERHEFGTGGSNERSGARIRIEEGQAIRLKLGAADELSSEDIPIRSSHGVLGNRERSDLGLSFLQGNIRLKETVSASDLRVPTSSWIEVIPEQRGVMLQQAIPVTLVAPGNYRVFGDSGQVIPAGTRVDSYLIHFRSQLASPVRGVLKFDQQIVGLICEADQLAVSDSVVGRNGMRYPLASNEYRGLEPRIRVENSNSDTGGGWTADELTVSQDMKTIGLSVKVNPGRGVDQLRVLVLSNDES